MAEASDADIATVVELVGIAEFQAKAKSMTDALRTAVLKDAATSGAKVILDSARRHAPVGTRTKVSKKKWGSRRPGQLRDSMTMRVRDKQDGHVMADVGPAPEGWYGRLEEWGVNNGKPFLRPAVDESQEEVTQIVGEKLRTFFEAQGT